MMNKRFWTGVFFISAPFLPMALFILPAAGFVGVGFDTFDLQTVFGWQLLLQFQGYGTLIVLFLTILYSWVSDKQRYRLWALKILKYPFGQKNPYGILALSFITGIIVWSAFFLIYLRNNPAFIISFEKVLQILVLIFAFSFFTYFLHRATEKLQPLAS